MFLKKFESHVTKLFRFGILSVCLFDETRRLFHNGITTVIARLYMDKFDKIAFESALKIPSHCNIYVDDTILIWPGRMKEVQEILQYFNNIHEGIKFTVEIKQNGEILIHKMQ